jgi:3'-5' exoribonuclease
MNHFEKPAQGPMTAPCSAQLPQPQEQIGCVIRFKELVRELSAPFQALFEKIFEMDEFWQQFVSSPSSINGHHSRNGGNLRHAVEVAQTALHMARDFEDLVDFDVLIAGALLHDLGKAIEYKTVRNSGWTLSDHGRMLGHKATGFDIVASAMRHIEGISPEQQLGLLNCLMSSAMGHELRPMQCLEAEIIAKADQLSASADLYRRSAVLRKNKPGFGVPHHHQPRSILHIRTSVDLDVFSPASRFAFVKTSKH